MDICFISTYPPAHCGIGTYTRDLACELIRQNHKVTVLSETRNIGTSGGREGERGGVSRALAEPAYKSAEPSVYALWNRAIPTGMRSLAAVAQSIVTAKNKPDVVHIQHEFGLFPDVKLLDEFCCTLARAEIEVAITLHTVPRWPSFAGYLRNLPRFVRYIVHTAEALAAMAHFGIIPTLIPHGCHLVESKPTEQMTIICPGFMGVNKGQLDIIHAWGQTTKLAAGGAKLIVAGECRDENYQQQLETAVREYGGSDVDLRIGFQSELDLAKLFSTASIVVLGSGAQTPFSASGQHHIAMGYGLPIIAKAVSIYRGPGVLFYRTQDECAYWMDTLADVRARVTLGDMIRDVAKTRTWPLVAEQHVKLYT